MCSNLICISPVFEYFCTNYQWYQLFLAGFEVLFPLLLLYQPECLYKLAPVGHQALHPAKIDYNVRASYNRFIYTQSRTFSKKTVIVRKETHQPK